MKKILIILILNFLVITSSVAEQRYQTFKGHDTSQLELEIIETNPTIKKFNTKCSGIYNTDFESANFFEDIIVAVDLSKNKILFAKIENSNAYFTRPGFWISDLIETYWDTEEMRLVYDNSMIKFTTKNYQTKWVRIFEFEETISLTSGVLSSKMRYITKDGDEHSIIFSGTCSGVNDLSKNLKN